MCSFSLRRMNENIFSFIVPSFSLFYLRAAHCVVLVTIKEKIKENTWYCKQNTKQTIVCERNELLFSLIESVIFLLFLLVLFLTLSQSIMLCSFVQSIHLLYFVFLSTTRMLSPMLICHYNITGI